MVRGSSGRAQLLLALEQPLRAQLPAQALDAGQQVALAGHAQVVDGEGEARGRARAARVVVAAARHHQLHPVLRAHALARAHRFPFVAPGAAGDRAGGVPQLEVHPRAGDRRFTSSPISCTRVKDRSLSRSAAAYSPTGIGAAEAAAGDARARGFCGRAGGRHQLPRIGASIDANAARADPGTLPRASAVAKRKSSKRERSRRPPSQRTQGEGSSDARAASSSVGRAAASGPPDEPSGERAGPRARAARGDAPDGRPRAPWHPLPLSELLILVGAVGVMVAVFLEQEVQPRAAGGEHRRGRDRHVRGDPARAPRRLSLPHRAAGAGSRGRVPLAPCCWSRAPSRRCPAGSTSRCWRSTSRSSACSTNCCACATSTPAANGASPAERGARPAHELAAAGSRARAPARAAAARPRRSPRRGSRR